jgi:hypothetical protein
VDATLGYGGSFTIVLPSGVSAQQVASAQEAVTQDEETLAADEQAGSDASTADSQSSAQQVASAQEAVTQDEETLAADEQAESDAAAIDSQAIATDQTTVNTDQSTLSSDEATESEDCAGSGASAAACSSDAQKVSSDEAQLTQAREQLDSAHLTANRDHDQNQAKLQSDETKLRGDQATLASLPNTTQSTATSDQNQAKVQSDKTKLQGDQTTLASLRATAGNPGTTYTALPSVGDVINEDQPVYSLSNQAVPLLYGAISAYRAFYVGMSDGGDVGQLTHDLIALGYGAGLTQSNHYSSATATAVERWQGALGLAATGEILFGQVVFEPGPIRVTSVTPSVGESVGGSGSGSGSGSGGAGTVLTATSTTREVIVDLDASQQSDVKVGDKVTITLPNNQTTPGVVSSVGTVATTPSSASSGSASGSESSPGSGSSGSSTPTVTVNVTPSDPAATGNLDQAPVEVSITTASVNSALVVPVDALVALANGGYAVETVSATGLHHLVPVSLGLFDDADGLVQVKGSGLSAGQRVVVPAQ